MTTDHIEQYLNRQTLIAGDVNSGKTTKTGLILQRFLEAGYGRQMAVLDLAPATVAGIGGKLALDSGTPVLYLTADIAAPRSMGRDAAHTLQLATENARKIEELLEEFRADRRDILFVNDATLYLQSGKFDLFFKTLEMSSTRIINAYYGTTFAESDLTRRERRLSDKLMDASDQVILL